MAVVLAIAAMLLIVLGSAVVIAAPNDGQTGMIAYPSWAVGIALGVASVNRALTGRASIVVWAVLGSCIMIAAACMLASVFAGMRKRM